MEIWSIFNLWFKNYESYWLKVYEMTVRRLKRSLKIKIMLDGSSRVNQLNIYRTKYLRVNLLVTTEILTKKISPIFYLCKLDKTSSNVLWIITMTS